MARWLLLTWGGGGNQPPMIALAQALEARGDAVTVAGYATTGAAGLLGS